MCLVVGFIGLMRRGNDRGTGLGGRRKAGAVEEEVVVGRERRGPMTVIGLTLRTDAEIADEMEVEHGRGIERGREVVTVIGTETGTESGTESVRGILGTAAETETATVIVMVRTAQREIGTVHGNVTETVIEISERGIDHEADAETIEETETGTGTTGDQTAEMTGAMIDEKTEKTSEKTMLALAVVALGLAVVEVVAVADDVVVAVAVLAARIGRREILIGIFLVVKESIQRSGKSWNGDAGRGG
jgi:hypothetical protein